MFSPQWMWGQWVKVWWETACVQSLKASLHKFFTNYKGRHHNVTLEKLADMTLTKGSKPTSSILGQKDILCPLVWGTVKDSTWLWSFCPKCKKLESHHEGSFRRLLQKPGFIKVRHHKERLGSCCRLKETNNPRLKATKFNVRSWLVSWTRARVAVSHVTGTMDEIFLGTLN